MTCVELSWLSRERPVINQNLIRNVMFFSMLEHLASTWIVSALIFSRSPQGLSEPLLPANVKLSWQIKTGKNLVKCHAYPRPVPLEKSLANRHAQKCLSFFFLPTKCIDAQTAMLSPSLDKSWNAQKSVHQCLPYFPRHPCGTSKVLGVIIFSIKFFYHFFSQVATYLSLLYCTHNFNTYSRTVGAVAALPPRLSLCHGLLALGLRPESRG